MTHRRVDHCGDRDRDGKRGEVRFVVSASTALFGAAAAVNAKSAAALAARVIIYLFLCSR